MDPGYWWGPMFGVSWMFPVVCFIIMAAVVFLIFRRAGGGCCMPMRHGPSAGRNDARETPRQILDRRLASGEITNQEHEETRRRIDSQ